MNVNEPVVVQTTNNPVEAEMLKNVLEGEGIACELDGENQAGFTGVFEIRVTVRAWDEERARKVLHAHTAAHDKHKGD